MFIGQVLKINNKVPYKKHNGGIYVCFSNLCLS